MAGPTPTTAQERANSDIHSRFSSSVLQQRNTSADCTMSWKQLGLVCCDNPS
jgi:hypothetical protein